MNVLNGFPPLEEMIHDLYQVSSRLLPQDMAFIIAVDAGTISIEKYRNKARLCAQWLEHCHWYHLTVGEEEFLLAA